MITIFQHGEHESSGEIGIYLQGRGLPFETKRLYETSEIPNILPSRLILLGGQMSVNDTCDYPFFTAEKQVIRKMVAQKRAVSGSAWRPDDRLGLRGKGLSAGKRVGLVPGSWLQAGRGSPVPGTVYRLSLAP